MSRSTFTGCEGSGWTRKLRDLRQDLFLGCGGVGAEGFADLSPEALELSERDHAADHVLRDGFGTAAGLAAGPREFLCQRVGEVEDDRAHRQEDTLCG